MEQKHTLQGEPMWSPVWVKLTEKGWEEQETKRGSEKNWLRQIKWDFEDQFEGFDSYL